MSRSTAAVWGMAGVMALGLTAAGCKPSAAASGDAGAVRGRALDAGPDGAVAAASPADAAPPDNGALPAASSDELTLRARHLFEAIVQDNPDLGSDLLFPRDACMVARDVKDPGRAWDAKFSSSFRRGVHSLHKRTKGIDRAQFVSFELGRTVTQDSPRAKEWKEPLWVVHHSRIDFTVDDRPLHIDIAELTSWRGAWYVTRLRGGTT